MNIFDKLRAVLSPEAPVPPPADRNFSSAVLVLLSDCADPDVVLINEFDYVPGNVAVDLFRDNYLERGQRGADRWSTSPATSRMRSAMMAR